MTCQIRGNDVSLAWQACVADNEGIRLDDVAAYVAMMLTWLLGVFDMVDDWVIFYLQTARVELAAHEDGGNDGDGTWRHIWSHNFLLLVSFSLSRQALQSSTLNFLF